MLRFRFKRNPGCMLPVLCRVAAGRCCCCVIWFMKMSCMHAPVMAQVLALAAAVEASSEHPVAAAVLDAAAARVAPDSVPVTPRSPAKGAAGGKRTVDWVWPAVEVENDHGALSGLPFNMVLLQYSITLDELVMSTV